MKIKFLLIALAFLFCHGCADKPDLEITAFESIGPSKINSKGEIELPVKIIITNRGEGLATRFNIVTEYLLPEGTFEAALVFSGMSFRTPIFDTRPLAADRELHVFGTVIFPEKHYGWTAVVKARLECCDREGPLPEHEHLEETYTDNNESWPIQVLLEPTEMASLR